MDMAGGNEDGSGDDDDEEEAVVEYKRDCDDWLVRIWNDGETGKALILRVSLAVVVLVKETNDRCIGTTIGYEENAVSPPFVPSHAVPLRSNSPRSKSPYGPG